MHTQDTSGKAYWLKMQRKKRGLTQKELAQLAGTSLRSIQAYEQGTRNLSGASVEVVQALCRVLDCREEDILSYPGGRTSSLSEYSDEMLCCLYGQRITDQEEAMSLPERLARLSVPEFRRYLTEEMAKRFYQSHKEAQEDILQ